MQVSKIEEFSASKSKIIFEDNSFIIVYKNDIRRFGFAEGVDVSDKQLEVLYGEILPYRAKARCMKLLQSRDYAEGELRKKLRGDGYPQTVIDVTVEYLMEYGYINDSRYIKLYYQCKSVKKSRKQIILDLQQKGISKESIMNVMGELYIDSETNGDVQCIRKLLRKRKYKDSCADIKEKDKTKAYLFRKGFELDDIIKCMHHFNWENM